MENFDWLMLKGAKILHQTKLEKEIFSDEEVKILIMGPEKTGKSTLFSHLKILYGDSSFLEDEKEVQEIKEMIYMNIFLFFSEFLTKMAKKKLLNEKEEVKMKFFTFKGMLL